MPFKSQAQRGYLYANEPEVAKKFEAATPKGVKLPYHVAQSGKKRKKSKPKKAVDSSSKYGYSDFERAVQLRA